ncbi:type III effector 1 [Pseudomonas sp. B21-032]|uniref:dermonecrotic toxin domain-containing protein n=1 Tax=Pseudomonas sp. B21-032 TaxID=2895483 RepID=UPI00215E7D77|nr:DUF6543 domain-containing protein [Pseudomonas sp. B21-032]UVL62232.1 type III effector 1 [Pseudomonas sp. B21-032]
MDHNTDPRRSVNDTSDIIVTPSPAVSTVHVLERLVEWKAAYDPLLLSQSTLLGVLEELLLVELRTIYKEGNIDPHFITALTSKVLERIIDPDSATADPEQDMPYQWPGAWPQRIDAGRQDAVTQAIEGAVVTFIDNYKDYLARHWNVATASPVEKGTFERLVKRRLEEHQAAIDVLFEPANLVGQSASDLRGKIVELQNAWRQPVSLRVLATPQECTELDAIARSQTPEWLRVLDKTNLAMLRACHERSAHAQAVLEPLIGEVSSLRGYARQLAKEYISLELDVVVEPDDINVQMDWKIRSGKEVLKGSLSELLASGPLRKDAVSNIAVVSDRLRNQPLSSAFIAGLMAEIDAPAGYLQALKQKYDRSDVKEALFDLRKARLQQSAFMARCAGHMKVTSYDDLEKVWGDEAEEASDRVLRVCGLTLLATMKCVDILLFYREDRAGVISDLLLYAPGKPDGQEWIALHSLIAVSEEVGNWTASAEGCEYLLQQLSPAHREAAQAHFAAVQDKPTLWEQGKDLRGAVTGFRACIEDAVAMEQVNHLQQVEREDSPPWYTQSAADERRIISSLNKELQVLEKTFTEQMKSYEVFAVFAKRTVKEAITPYLREKGVLEPVDPETIQIDYMPGLGDGASLTANLVDLAIYGYDDNSGIDNPNRGVRSSVGQDLSQVRSADLAQYVRRAYLGGKYAQKIRAQFLDSQDSLYTKRRSIYGNTLLVRMDRDLRVALVRSRLSVDEHAQLSRLVSLLGVMRPADSDITPGTVVQRSGVFKFTVSGYVVVGAYVFRVIDQDTAEDWLYMPDAPDGVVLRRYQDFSAQASGTLRDYVVERVALTARTSVKRSLRNLSDGTGHLDALREFNRVTDVGAEFDAYIERAITDVEDTTTSRAEVIKGQVIKGVLFASAPICMVCPPFVLILDIAFLTLSIKQAVESHSKGDTSGALVHWLEASWGVLFAEFGGIARIFWRGAVTLKQSVRPLSHAFSRGRTAMGGRQAAQSEMQLWRFDSWAVARKPNKLEQVTEEGIWQGTYRDPASQKRYVKSKDKFFEVVDDQAFIGLSVVNPRNRGSSYKLGIRRRANGEWQYSPPGIRGGNEDVSNLGRISDLREAFPGHVQPSPVRGAMQGEAVVARFVSTEADNYLYSLNAQTCVIASMYNPLTKAGAVIHFDHNIRSLIEDAVKKVTESLGGAAAAKNIRSTLVGGDWLSGGADIGGPVREVMRRHGLQPSWDYWSYSSCFGNTYGVALDLRNGATSVFRTSQDQVVGFYGPVLGTAKGGAKDSVAMRARNFIARFRRDPLVENANSVVRNHQGRQATQEEIKQQAISIVALT